MEQILEEILAFHNNFFMLSFREKCLFCIFVIITP